MRFPGKKCKKYEKKVTESWGRSTFKGRSEEEKKYVEWEKPGIWEENKDTANHGTKENNLSG